MRLCYICTGFVLVLSMSCFDCYFEFISLTIVTNLLSNSVASWALQDCLVIFPFELF